MKSEQEIKKDIERLKSIKIRFAYLNDDCIDRIIAVLEGLLKS